MADEPQEPEAARTEAKPADLDETGTLHPKRLPGLWIICVLFGLSGFFGVALACLATLRGSLVFGGLAVAFVAATVGLWGRSNVMRIGAMALLGLAFACAVGDGILHGGAEALIPSAIGLCPVVVAIVYLHLRRGYFKVPGHLKPRLVSANGIVTMAAVVCIGVAGVLLLAVDDPPMSFPRLALEATPVAEQDNALPVFSDMMVRFPIREDPDIGRLLYPQDPEKPMSTEEWTAQAREVLTRWKECLAETDEMLGRKTLALEASDAASFEPPGETEWLGYCRQLARLLTLESKLHCYDGMLSESLNAAHRIASLGSLLCGQNVDLMSYLTGIVILSMGQEHLREAAANKMMSRDLVLPEIPRLEIENLLRGGMARAMSWELTRQRLFWQRLKEGRAYSMTRVGSHGGWAGSGKLLRDHMPLIKTNMSLNMVGALFEEVLDRLDHYEPLPEDISSHARGFFARRFGWFHHTRNPIGDILVQMLAPAWGRMPVVYFRSLANARLTEIFLALRCYQLDNGVLPASLGELVPKYFAQVPVDPFTERPFVYEPDATPRRLYSVGPDQRPDAPDAREKDDIVVELNFPAPAK